MITVSYNRLHICNNPNIKAHHTALEADLGHRVRDEEEIPFSTYAKVEPNAKNLLLALRAATPHVVAARVSAQIAVFSARLPQGEEALDEVAMWLADPSMRLDWQKAIAKAASVAFAVQAASYSALSAAEIDVGDGVGSILWADEAHRTAVKAAEAAAKVAGEDAAWAAIRAELLRLISD
jgi:hypothetical protein